MYTIKVSGTADQSQDVLGLWVWFFFFLFGLLFMHGKTPVVYGFKKILCLQVVKRRNKSVQTIRYLKKILQNLKGFFFQCIFYFT